MIRSLKNITDALEARLSTNVDLRYRPDFKAFQCSADGFSAKGHGNSPIAAAYAFLLANGLEIDL